MEQKHVLLSALSVGVGVGLGLGLASGHNMSRLTGGNETADKIEQELMRQVIDGRDSNVTFDEFPYFLSERIQILLMGAAYIHLKHSEVFKHTQNLSPPSKTILLSGLAPELYQQMLAKALAHIFESKLLLLDVTNFSSKMQRKYGYSKIGTSFHKSISEMTLDRMSTLFGSLSTVSTGEEKRALLRHTSSWCFDEKQFLKSLYKVLVLVSEKSPLILYLRDVDKILLQSQRMYNLFNKFLNKLPDRVLILGSRKMDQEDDCREVDERLITLFPYSIEIQLPEDEPQLVGWKNLLEEDMKLLQLQDNKNHITEVLAANDIECDDLGAICHADTILLGKHIEEILVLAISYHLMNNKDPGYRNGKLLISSNSLLHGLSICQLGKNGGKDRLKLETNAEAGKGSEVGEAAAAKTESKPDSAAKKDGENPSSSKAPEVPPDNEFERRIRSEVIPPNETGVTFADIGALDEIKESLQELVMLPLRRPDLFRGGLLKPCRGILLFGPPGTGKTMLAKAIANEAGASFINVSMSTITSKWFGEDEKNVRALFTLAAKVAPTIIFVDEVDSMLGQRTRVGEHEAMRKIKNEFMTHWDGLLTKSGMRILVLAATNRPFDLDEAIIRRFERRIMVGLPSVESRERILNTFLSKEKTEDLDLKELAAMTEGYSGSDLKNLCVTAAYRPVRELLQQERMKEKERNEKGASEKAPKETQAGGKEEGVINLRPLNMEDMRQAKNQVAASFAAEGSIMGELKQWNDLYGEGGSRKKEQLTYFI